MYSNGGDIAGSKSRIVFFVPEWPASESGILASQVLAVAGYLARQGLACLFIGSERSKQEAEKTEAILRDRHQIDVKIFGCYPSKPDFLQLAITVYRVYVCSRPCISEFMPTHVYSRSCMASLFGRRMAKDHNAISVYDVRAVLAAEVATGGGLQRIKARCIDYWEQNEIRKADRLATVSMNLNKYIMRRSGRSCASIIPSCYDDNQFFPDESTREQARAELELSKTDKIICYSGGVAHWQRISDIILLFEQIASQLEAAKFIILTPATDRLHEILKSGKFRSRYRIKNCRPGEVCRYLCASDAGIIMRQDTIINNVASPIKVAEYLACGLPVILTKGIGDYSETLIREGIGVLLDESDDLAEQVTKFLTAPNFSELQKKAAQYATQRLTHTANWQQYKHLFGQ